MNISKILLPVDFSPSSHGALAVASTLAQESNAVLYLVHVSDDSAQYLAGYGGFAYTPELSQQVAAENAAELEKIEPTKPNVRVQRRCLSGNPAVEILAFAEAEQVDLIVLGSHGRTGLSRLLLGSVAEEVVRRARCAVLTIKRPLGKEGEASHPEEPTQASSTPHYEPVTRHSLH